MLIFIFSSRIIECSAILQKDEKEIIHIGDPHQTIPALPHHHQQQRNIFYLQMEKNYLQNEKKEHNWVLNAKWILWEHSTFSTSSNHVKFYTHLMCAHKQYRHYSLLRKTSRWFFSLLILFFYKGGPLQTPLTILLICFYLRFLYWFYFAKKSAFIIEGVQILVHNKLIFL